MKRIQACLFVALLGGLLAAPSDAQELDAKIEKFSINDVLKGGQDYTVTVEVRNPYNSGMPWASDAGYKLIMELSRGSSAGDEAFTHSLDLKYDVAPNEKTTFQWKITAPRVPGDYKISLYMADRGGKFGDTKLKTITVSEDHAVRITKRSRTSGDPLTEHELRFKLTNTGTTDWPDAKYSLKVEPKSAPSGATREDRQTFNFTIPLDLGEWRDEVLPGEDVEAAYEIVLPRAHGPYGLTLTLLKDGKPFGIPGHKGTMQFRVQKPDEEVTLRKIDIPKTMKVKRAYKAKFYIKNTGDIMIDVGDWGVTCEARPIEDKKAKKFTFSILGKEMLMAGDEEDLREDVKLPQSFGKWEFSCKAILNEDEVGRPMKKSVTIEG